MVVVPPHTQRRRVPPVAPREPKLHLFPAKYQSIAFGAMTFTTQMLYNF
jgi:hypothetical protein